MGLLVLVRHGQAAFLSDDYDRLTPSGEAQARTLGEFWAKQRTVFDEVFTGSLVRQIRTAELVGDQIRASGAAWPQAQVIQGLDEYDGAAVMTALLPLLSRQDTRVNQLAELYESSRGKPDEHKAFQRLFEAVTMAWIDGNISPPGLRSWQDFTNGVRQAIHQAVSGEGTGRRIVVFTSGGPISAAVQLALGLSDRKTLELNWQIRNCSLTEFLFSNNRLTLDRFNCLTHLPDRSQWTYR